jgi:hypothetical protein
LFNKPYYGITAYLYSRRIGASLILQVAFFQSTVADHQPVRYAYQFHIRKHDSGTLVSVINDDIDA